MKPDAPAPQWTQRASLVISGSDLKAIRRGLNLSTAQFGYALGYAGATNTSSVTIRRYEAGGRPIPPWIGRLALMFERFGVPEDFLSEPDQTDGS